MYELDEKKYMYLFVIIPILVMMFIYLQYWKNKKQKEFGDILLIKKLTPDHSKLKPILKFIIVITGLSFIIIALINPKIGSKLETVKREGIDIVFAVDVSKSMLAEDIAPSRLEKSKQIVSQIINQLGSDRIGIVAYAGSAYPVLPVTTDYSVAKMFLQSMNTDMVSSQGTAINEAIQLASTYFDKDEVKSRVLVIISDGEDHSEEAEAAAENAAELGMKIITIGVGTTKGGPIPIKTNGIVKSFLRDDENEVVITKMNSEVLESIAKTTKGTFIEGNNTKNMINSFNEVLNDIEKTEFETQKISDYKDQFQWFVGIAFILMFLDIFVLEKKTGWLKKLNLFNEKES